MRNSLAEARGAREVSQETAKRMSVASEQGTGHTFIMIDRSQPLDNINSEMFKVQKLNSKSVVPQ